MTDEGTPQEYAKGYAHGYEDGKAAGVTLAPRPAPDTLLDVERVRRALHMAHSNYGPGACGLSADDFISDYEAER